MFADGRAQGRPSRLRVYGTVSDKELGLARLPTGAQDLARLAHHAEAADDGEAALRFAPAAAEWAASVGGTPRGRGAICAHTSLHGAPGTRGARETPRSARARVLADRRVHGGGQAAQAGDRVPPAARRCAPGGQFASCAVLAGTRNLYALAPGGMAAAQQWLVNTWDAVLGAYAAAVERSLESKTAPLG